MQRVSCVCTAWNTHTVHQGITSAEKHENSCWWFYTVYGPLPYPRNSLTQRRSQSTHTFQTAQPFLCARTARSVVVCLWSGIYHEVHGGGVDWSTVSLADGNDEKCLLWNPVRHGLPASGCTPFPHNQESWVMLLLSGQDRAALHLCSTGMLPRNVWVTHHTSDDKSDVRYCALQHMRDVQIQWFPSFF